MTEDGRTEHGDVMLTEDGMIFVVYRAHPLHSLTGLLCTDGDIDVESMVDLGVDYRALTDDESRARSAQLTHILGTTRDVLEFSRDDMRRTGCVEEAEAYEADLRSLDDAARIILPE
jgi:hypothetical protein